MLLPSRQEVISQGGSHFSAKAAEFVLISVSNFKPTVLMRFRLCRVRLEVSGFGIRRGEKRRRAAALQNLAEHRAAPGWGRVVECGSPLPLFPEPDGMTDDFDRNSPVHKSTFVVRSALPPLTSSHGFAHKIRPAFR